MMSASAEASSDDVRTSNGSAPALRTARACASKSPWRASTPTFTVLPASFGQPLGLRHRAHVEAAHRLAETAGDLPQDVGIVEVCRRLDHGLRACVRGGALQDPTAHAHACPAAVH